MADDWLWQSRRLPPTRSVVPATPGPMPVPRMTSSVVQLHLAELDASYQLGVQALLEMLARTPLRQGVVTYDPRLEVIRGFFIAGGRGDLTTSELARAIQAEVVSMRDAPLALLLGCEMAKAGFLSMGLPHLAAPYAREAARGWVALRRLADSTRLEAERLELPEGGEYDWQE